MLPNPFTVQIPMNHARNLTWIILFVWIYNWNHKDATGTDEFQHLN